MFWPKISSALTRGYLYAAASPSKSSVLGDIGFKPQGENFSLKPVKGRTQGATRMDKLIKELIDKSRIIGVSHKSAARNVKMMTTTALLCVFSIALYIYIYLNLSANSLNTSTCYWRFHHSHAHSTTHSTTDNHSSNQYLVKQHLLPTLRVDDDSAMPATDMDTFKFMIWTTTWNAAWKHLKRIRVVLGSSIFTDAWGRKKLAQTMIYSNYSLDILAQERASRRRCPSVMKRITPSATLPYCTLSKISTNFYCVPCNRFPNLWLQ